MDNFSIDVLDVKAPDTFIFDEEGKKVSEAIRLLLLTSLEGFLFCIKNIFLPGRILPEHIQEHDTFAKMKLIKGGLIPLDIGDNIESAKVIVVLAFGEKNTFELVCLNRFISRIYFSSVHNGNPKEILGVKQTNNGFQITLDTGVYDL